jgi:ABC-type transport system involved in cytochrome bd biosynthesis fused ATPase/permease subunit
MAVRPRCPWQADRLHGAANPDAAENIMAPYQYVYHMEGVSKTYPGGKKCFENIHLNFLPGVKIGVVGVNGGG